MLDIVLVFIVFGWLAVGLYSCFFLACGACVFGWKANYIFCHNYKYSSEWDNIISSALDYLHRADLKKHHIELRYGDDEIATVWIGNFPYAYATKHPVRGNCYRTSLRTAARVRSLHNFLKDHGKYEKNSN